MRYSAQDLERIIEGCAPDDLSVFDPDFPVVTDDDTEEVPT